MLNLFKSLLVFIISLWYLIAGLNSLSLIFNHSTIDAPLLGSVCFFVIISDGIVLIALAKMFNIKRGLK